ncbi:Cys-tRNA(Pro)/Cys-tRNA(Cys) deacylase [Raineyella antarctica]|uniref:Cys-tRNA(Pro)/Cys-tRNA(Cys) deacylase n=1 Tax=Raineyella antarctica TaxID=1577474 RepID=A0A1G6GTI0_9ACTN|nr:Cys-tRNA(Pro) deacylase [Raineyella antarctica]SDB85221.1 Cys-tRNA(Pro)/Cys-tRNA(Cys) deacylase [Raineyella antarctica]
MAKRTRRAHEPAGTPALLAVERAGVDHRLHEHATDVHAEGEIGPESARQLGVSPDRVFKTLVADCGGRLVVAVVPVSHHLDLKALARAMGAKKAQMADPAVAERSSGYVVGGISPLGQRTTLPTVVDDSALDHETIFVSAGKRSLKLEIAPADLVELCAAVVAPIRT